MAARKTSRGCTIVSLREPRLTRQKFFSLNLVSSEKQKQCSLSSWKLLARAMSLIHSLKTISAQSNVSLCSSDADSSRTVTILISLQNPREPHCSFDLGMLFFLSV